MKYKIGNEYGSYTFSASGKTITMTGLPYDLVLSQVLFVQNTTTGQTLYNPFDTTKLGTLTSNVLTVATSTSGMNDSDRLLIFIDIPQLGSDATGDTVKISNQNPDSSYNVDVVPLISSAQNLTGSWADLGFEIPCFGYKKLTLWITLAINNSLDVGIRVLGKHTSAGSEEYNLPIESITATKIDVSPAYWELTNDSNQLIKLDVDINNTTPYIQPQCIAGTVGGTAGQITAMYYTLGY